MNESLINTQPAGAGSEMQPVEITDDPTTLKILINEMVKAIMPNGRAKSAEMTLAARKLQEAGFWVQQHQIQE